MALIFIMVDGVGIAAPGPDNAVTTALPQLSEILGGPLCAGERGPSDHHWHPIDATLGVSGLPQSGTGHTAIYGGFNAAAANGRHQPAYPTVALKARLAEQNLFRAALEQGKRVAWANAYLPGYAAAVEARRLRHTAGTWAALSAGIRLRTVDDLLAECAVAWDIDQHLARQRPGCEALPHIEPAQAGARLVQLATAYDLVGFETYLPDLAGHGRLTCSPTDALQLVDGMLAAIATDLGAADTLVVVSDHGNVEDMTTRLHTRNPVPLIAIGPHSTDFNAVQSIDGVMAALLSAL